MTSDHVLVHAVPPCRQKNLTQSFGNQKLQRRRDINTSHVLMFMQSVFQVIHNTCMHSFQISVDDVTLLYESDWLQQLLLGCNPQVKMAPY